MASYKDIVRKTKSLADVISRGVANKAPIKTGNLRAQLRKANTINTMLDTRGMNSKELGNESITISIDYAPTGATYGKFWNDPTVSKTVRKGKTKNVPKSINFVDKALNDAKVEAAIDELIDMLSDNIVAMIEEKLNKVESEY